MGIHGIYKEIGPGQRISLAKLAVQKFEDTNRPLRIAIDISIWLFQIQSSKGGTNPALRTFYYRLLRLISLSIHPLFVFDGPNKPPFKRNKQTRPNVASIPEFLAKQLLKQFGIPFHLAPGEAEAECALLQREGIVDAVLSEDVDTLMFGSGLTIRNWSPEPKTAKVATHVNLYDASKTQETSGLDREGMVLVALMSGGDYVPDGIPGCGPKLACEAARAGFGKELCQISRKDETSLRIWRERLEHELRSNESGYFKSKHKALKIPSDFPNLEALGFYRKPCVSTLEKLRSLRETLAWDNPVDFPSLRTFTAEAFQWSNLGGAKKFIRNLAPALLVRDLRLRGIRADSTDDLDVVKAEEQKLIKGLHGSRTHISTDGSIEIRVSFLPIDIVNIDLSQEPPDDVLEEDGNDSDDDILPAADADATSPAELAKKRTFNYDPNDVEKLWILESYVKVGVPLTIEDWEAEMTRKAAAKTRSKRAVPKDTGSKSKPRSRRDQPQTSTQPGALDRFTRVTKPGTQTTGPTKTSQTPIEEVDLSLENLPSGSTRKESTTSMSSVPQAPQSRTPKASRQGDILDLLSPETNSTAAPVDNPLALAPSAAADKPASPVPPARRSRRTPMRRTQTLPATIPQQPPGVESIDLSSSPVSTPRTRRTRNVASTLHASPRAMRQWLQGPGNPDSARLRPHAPRVEEIDLTDSPERSHLLSSRPQRHDSANENSTAQNHVEQEPQPSCPISSNRSLSDSSAAMSQPTEECTAREKRKSVDSDTCIPRKEKKRVLQVRESLDGAFKILDESPSRPCGTNLNQSRWRLDEVEVLDLAET